MGRRPLFYPFSTVKEKFLFKGAIFASFRSPHGFRSVIVIYQASPHFSPLSRVVLVQPKIYVGLSPMSWMMMVPSVFDSRRHGPSVC